MQVIQVDIEEEKEERGVSARERLLRLLRVGLRVGSINWACACFCRGLNFALRSLIALSIFESAVVIAIAVYIILDAYSNAGELGLSRGTFYPSMLMVLLVVGLWSFLVSAVRRENDYELAGANILSALTCSTPLYMMMRTAPDEDAPPSPPAPPSSPDTSFSRTAGIVAARLERILQNSRGSLYLGLGISACIVGAAFILASLEVSRFGLLLADVSNHSVPSFLSHQLARSPQHHKRTLRANWPHVRETAKAMRPDNPPCSRPKVKREFGWRTFLLYGDDPIRKGLNGRLMLFWLFWKMDIFGSLLVLACNWAFLFEDWSTAAGDPDTALHHKPGLPLVSPASRKHPNLLENLSPSQHQPSKSPQLVPN